MMFLDLVVIEESQFIVQSYIFNGGMALTNEETFWTSGILVNPTEGTQNLILGIYFEEWEIKLVFFFQIHWLILIFKIYQNLSIITAWQPWVIFSKDIFPFVTMTDGCKKVNFMESVQ